MVLLGGKAQLELVLVCLEIVLILTQDWCTLCAECSIGSQIILDAHPMKLLVDVGHVESRSFRLRCC